MRSALIPVLMPTGLPKRGLVCWHDLYDPTSSLASVPDLSGNGYSLQLGSDAGADSNDPAWGADGKGLVHTTDDYALTGHLSGVTMAGDWTAIVAGLFNQSDGYPWTFAASGVNNMWNGIYCPTKTGNLRALSYDGTLSQSSSVAVSTTDPVVVALRSSGGTLSLLRIDTMVQQSVANRNPTGTARIAVGAVGNKFVSSPATAMTSLSHLFYNRVLSNAEIQRTYRSLKATWAARGVTIL